MTYNREYGAGTALSDSGRAWDVGTAGTSLIDRDSYFSGVYRSPRDLRIEGEYEGEIECEGTVVVAASARVSGTVNAGSVLISGQLQGQVTCSGRFEILATGQVTARVAAGSVIVHEGAFYEGDLRMHVAPEGLPEREVSTAAAVGDAGAARGRAPGGAAEGAARVDAEAVSAAANGREQNTVPTLRAVTEG